MVGVNVSTHHGGSDGANRAAHPLAPDQLAWAIDEERSIDLAVAYKAGRYFLKPYRNAGFRGAQDYPRYAVYFNESGYPARHALRNGGSLRSVDAMEFAQRHHARQLKKSTHAGRRGLRRARFGMFDDFLAGVNKSAEKVGVNESITPAKRPDPAPEPEVGVNDPVKPKAKVGVNNPAMAAREGVGVNVDPVGVNERVKPTKTKVGVNTSAKPEVGVNKPAAAASGNVGVNTPRRDQRKGDRHRPRKGDRHSPGYMREYMRRRRAGIRKGR
jgi:hypothetical protein